MYFTNKKKSKYEKDRFLLFMCKKKKKKIIKSFVLMSAVVGWCIYRKVKKPQDCTKSPNNFFCLGQLSMYLSLCRINESLHPVNNKLKCVIRLDRKTNASQCLRLNAKPNS